jgi:hypothetical protein
MRAAGKARGSGEIMMQWVVWASPADLLLRDEDEGVLVLGLHALLVGDEVGAGGVRLGWGWG